MENGTQIISYYSKERKKKDARKMIENKGLRTPPHSPNAQVLFSMERPNMLSKIICGTPKLLVFID